MGTLSAESLRSHLFCTECGRPFAPDDLAHFGPSVVCAACKPAFVQRMREGALSQTGVVYGGFWRRFVAYMIDGVILTILTSPVTIVFTLLIQPDIQHQTPEKIAAKILAFTGLVVIVDTAIHCSYYAYFLSRRAATPGKMAMGLKVITAGGGPIGVGRAIARFFSLFLSSIVLCIGFIMAAFDSEKRALHDHICGTRVVRETA